MANDNVVTLTGNLTREPELRFTPTGQATATFGFAVNRSWTDRQTHEKKEVTSFFNVVTWGTLAENAATSLARGTRVIVVGRLDQRSWETQEGEKRSIIEITADNIGPDLRWATVNVVRNERRTPGDGEYAQPPQQYAQTPAQPAYAPNPAAIPPPQYQQPVPQDDEPF